MIAVPGKTTIVLVGSFNPGILTPQWIARHVLEYEEGREIEVEMVSPVPGVALGPSVITFDGISYSVSQQKLTFYLGGKTPAEAAKTCAAVARLLDLLPHTPVAGLGFNFGFSVPEPRQELFDILVPGSEMASAIGEDAEIVGRAWRNVVSWRGIVVNVTCTLEGSSVQIDTNFHYGVNSAAEASRELKEATAFSLQMNAAIAAARVISHEEILEQ